MLDLVQVGEYVGTVRRGAEAARSSGAEPDPYTMRYPDASGELSLSAKDGGSLMRFVNHAPAGSTAHNCDVRPCPARALHAHRTHAARTPHVPRVRRPRWNHTSLWSPPPRRHAAAPPHRRDATLCSRAPC